MFRDKSDKNGPRCTDRFYRDLTETLPSPGRASGAAAAVREAYGFEGLPHLNPDELCCPALPASSIRALASALELARRLGAVQVRPRLLAGTPAYLARWVHGQTPEKPMDQAPEKPMGQAPEKPMGLLLLDKRSTVKRIRWLPAEIAVDTERVRRFIVETAVIHRPRAIVPVIRSPSPARIRIPNLTEETLAFDLVVSPPLLMYEDGSWSCSTQHGKVEAEDECFTAVQRLWKEGTA